MIKAMVEMPGTAVPPCHPLATGKEKWIGCTPIGIRIGAAMIHAFCIGASGARGRK
jgi:hypothetical protein